jgi:DNA-binding Xre family transcriptional regulator
VAQHFADGPRRVLVGICIHAQPYARCRLAFCPRKRLIRRVTLGHTLDNFLDDDGLLAEKQAVAIKRIIAFRLGQAMQQEGLTKAELARRMGTSRSALNRLLDPENTSITLLTLEKAAKALGQRIRIDSAT